MMFANNEETKATVGAQFHCANASVSPATNPSRSIAALPQGFGKAGLLLATCVLCLASAPAALAQGECGLQTDPGNPETVTCDPQDYPGGITYDSLGNLTLEVPDDSVDLRLLDDGASVTGIGGDNIFWDSGAFVSGEIVGDASDPDNPGTFDGAVLDYLSDTGDIDILVGGNIKGMDSASHAIRAESTGGGSVSVTAEGDVNRRVSFLDPDPSGIGIEALTTTGDIVITALGRVESGRAGGLYTIHAGSSAGGNIDIAASDIILASSSGGASHGILAETTSAGAVTIDTDSLVLGGSFAGIEARTGSGNIGITAGARISSGNLGTGVIAETGGAGEITLNLAPGGRSVQGGSGGGIRAITGSGDITINTGQAGAGGNDEGGIAIVTQTDGLATINLSGPIVGVTGSSLGFLGAGTAIRSSGGSVLVNVAGSSSFGPGDDILDAILVSAPFDFSALDGTAEVNFSPASAWILTDQDSAVGEFADRSVFSPGDNVVNIAAGAFLSTAVQASGSELKSSPDTLEEARFIAEFGAGRDVVNNAGTIYVLPGTGISVQTSFRTVFPGELRLSGLAEFNNAGTIWLGRSLDFQISGPNKTDSWPDDVFAVPGATFHGEPGSRIILDAGLGKVGQASCTPAARDENDDFPVADCINIENGAATGRTLIEIRQLIPGDRGAFNPEGSVLVDLTGGDPAETDPDAFGIHPDSRDYSPAQGGIIDKGLFFYTVAFDPAVQQFKLFGFPSSGTQQMPLFGHMANQLWRDSAGAWFDRRVDQREIDRDDLGGSFWIRTGRNDGEHDVITPIQAGGETLNFDNSYSQDNSTTTIGTDFIARSRGDRAWVVGGMLGYGRGDIAFDASPNSAILEGMHFGLYGSLALDAFYVDVAVNHTWLDMDFDVPALQLTPETALTRSDVESLGGRIEAGWRWRAGRLSVEPLLGYTHVTSDFEDISIPADDATRFGGEASFDDLTSSRGSLGVRLRLDDVAPGIVPASVGLTARAIEEFDGDSDVVVKNIGPIDAPATDTFDGTFGQVTGDVSVTNLTKTVAGYLKVDGVFHDDYDSLSVTAGFRTQW